MFLPKKRTIFACLYLLVLSGCYTRQEGCLDTWATNYEVTADDACDKNCCTYPRLSFTLLHQWGDSTILPSDTITNQVGQVFRVTDVRCYMTSVLLHNKIGGNISSNSVLTKTDGQTITDDFLLLRLADQTLTGPQYRTYGDIDSVSFQAGLEEEIANARWESLPETHVLSPKNQLKTRDNTLASLVIKVSLIRAGQEDLPLIFALKAGINSGKTAFSTAIVTKKGENIPIPLHLDYHALLSNVDFAKKEEEIVSRLSQNLRQFIVVK